MKRTLSLFLALTLLLTLFTGIVSAHAEDEVITLTVAVEANALIDDYQNNLFTQYLEEKFGVHLHKVIK